MSLFIFNSEKVRFFIISCFLCLLPIMGNGAQKTVVLTVPKSGTHLVNKYFVLLREIHPEVPMPDTTHYYVPERPELYINPIVKPILNPENPARIIFFIRDIRDALVSILFHFEAGLFAEDVTLNTKTWTIETSLGQKMIDYIDGNASTGVLEWTFKGNLEYFKEFYSLKKPKIVVKFEDLVGPKGGGDAASQLQAIHKLAHFVGVSLTPTEANRIAENLFGVEGVSSQKDNEVFDINRNYKNQGKSVTFRKGTIGTWKNYFSPEHIAAFKKKYQWFLEEFNYEENDQW